MDILTILFLLSLLGGQLVRIPIFPGVTIYLQDLMLVVLYGFAFIRERTRIHIQALQLYRGMSLCMLAVAISLTVNMSLYSWTAVLPGVLYAFRFVLYMGLYPLVRFQKKTTLWVYGLYATGVVFSVIGIIQYIWYPNLRNLEYLGWDPHYYRLFSTFLDPNFAGLYIVLTFFLGLYVYSLSKRTIGIVLAEGVTLIALLFTLSRSSYLALLCPILFYMCWKKTWKLLIPIVIFLFLAFLLPFPNRNVTSLLRTDTGIARMTNWSYSIGLIQRAPVFGHGFNFLRNIQEPESLMKQDNEISHASAGVDNSFLFVLATTGIVGCAAFTYLLYQMWMMGMRLVTHTQKSMLGVVYLLSLVAIGIHSLFVNSIFYPWILIWVWILTGIVERDSKTHLR